MTAMNPIETLICEMCPPTVTYGFKQPFAIDRMCAAFGETLGGNAPQVSWFDGYDVIVATRRTMDATPHVAVVLRRQSDGALRFVASDSIQVRAEPGADFMLARQHAAIVHDALLEACDEGEIPAAIHAAMAAVNGASNSIGDGPVDILAVRRDREDLADVRTMRRITPAIADLRNELNRLSSPDRRAATLRLLEAIEAELGTAHGE